jgi:hypothetical protein
MYSDLPMLIAEAGPAGLTEDQALFVSPLCGRYS